MGMRPLALLSCRPLTGRCTWLWTVTLVFHDENSLARKMTGCSWYSAYVNGAVYVQALEYIRTPVRLS